MKAKTHHHIWVSKLMFKSTINPLLLLIIIITIMIMIIIKIILIPYGNHHVSAYLICVVASPWSTSVSLVSMRTSSQRGTEHILSFHYLEFLILIFRYQRGTGQHFIISLSIIYYLNLSFHYYNITSSSKRGTEQHFISNLSLIN